MTEPTATGGNGDGFLAALFDLNFDRMITLRFLRVIYLVLLVMSGLGVLYWVLASVAYGGGSGVAVLIIGAVAWFAYAILSRIGLEVIAILFKINENTSRLVEALERRD
ncbi:MAG: DUF4282 domain-containing protein [Actinomycetes bacterium]|jgi:hypothetical protein